MCADVWVLMNFQVKMEKRGGGRRFGGEHVPEENADGHYLTHVHGIITVSLLYISAPLYMASGLREPMRMERICYVSSSCFPGTTR